VIVLVGSTRPAKIEGVREALAAIARVDPRFAAATIQSHDLTAIAPQMPMSIADIVNGARRRAQALLSDPGPTNDEARFAVGLEGGLDELPAIDSWTLVTWAAVTDGKRWGYGAGPSIVLPASVSQRVVAGEELGGVIDGIAGESVRGTRGAWGLLTLDLIGRRDAFRLAVTAAFAPFYNAGWPHS
jgi:inosine/xanthosine triphosphatase